MALVVSAGYALGVALARSAARSRQAIASVTGLLVEARAGHVAGHDIIDAEIKRAERLAASPEPLTARAGRTAAAALDAIVSHPQADSLIMEYLTAMIGGLHRQKGVTLEITTRRQNHPDHLHRLPDIAA